jgi:hypothetical protein
MAYRWKPTARQKVAYSKRCKEREGIGVKTTQYAIREGCYVKYYSMNRGEIISGTVVNSSYGIDKNQHTFTIQTENNDKVLVKGRNLYPNIIEHIQGEISKQL